MDINTGNERLFKSLNGRLHCGPIHFHVMFTNLDRNLSEFEFDRDSFVCGEEFRNKGLKIVVPLISWRWREHPTKIIGVDPKHEFEGLRKK